MTYNIVEVKNLKKYFFLKKGVLGTASGVIKAVDDVSFTIERGKNLGVVGESGSGKTTLGKTIMRLYDPTEGEIWLDGVEISKLKGYELKKVRRRMQMVFQDPASSLNPRRDVRSIITAPLDIHGVGTKKERLIRAKELLNNVELSEDYLYRRPANLSGGEKQRVSIARALALNPDVVVLDEPTSSLDVSVQAKILTLLADLQKKLKLTYILITHDLSVVRNVTDNTIVMYHGRLVERSTTDNVFNDPLHPYTQTLLSSLPVIFDEELALLPKVKPLPDTSARQTDVTQGCPFFDRCAEKIGERCLREELRMTEVKKGHYVSCVKYY